MAEKKILLGRISSAHGIKGEILIRAFTETAQGLIDYGALDAGNGRTIKVTHAKATNKGVIARVEGVTDRNGAEALKGLDLYVDRARLPEPEGDAYYHEDLIGLEAVDVAGVRIGRVRGVENYGAGDILAVETGARGDELLVPFLDAYVPEVDIKAGRITIIPPVMTGDEDEEGQDAGNGAP